jgi:hypothetical protein
LHGNDAMNGLIVIDAMSDSATTGQFQIVCYSLIR